MSRVVIWSRPASQDLAGIYKHIASDSPAAASRTATAIRLAGDRLGSHSTGRPGRSGGHYEKSVPNLPYIIAYEITGTDFGEVIQILRVIHTARDWPAGGWPKD